MCRTHLLAEAVSLDEFWRLRNSFAISVVDKDTNLNAVGWREDVHPPCHHHFVVRNWVLCQIRVNPVLNTVLVDEREGIHEMDRPKGCASRQSNLFHSEFSSVDPRRFKVCVWSKPRCSHPLSSRVNKIQRSSYFSSSLSVLVTACNPEDTSRLLSRACQRQSWRLEDMCRCLHEPKSDA